MNKDLISIIVPVYRAEKYLNKCIESLINQTYTNLEIILIDDGSPDNCADICKTYCEQDKRVKYFCQENQGVSAARNKGIKLAQGKYLGFCDADDYVDLDMYEVLYKLNVENNADISIISSYYNINGKIQDYKDNDKIESFSNVEAIKEMFLGKKFAGHLWNKLFRRELFEGLYLNENIAICEDLLLLWDLIFRSKKIVFQDIHKYYYVENEGSAIYSFKETSWTVQEASNQLYIKTMTFLPKLQYYAQMSKIALNVWLAEVLVKSKKLNSKNYLRIKKDIDDCVNKHSLKLFDNASRIKAKVLIRSRFIFQIMIRLEKIKFLSKIVKRIIAAK